MTGSSAAAGRLDERDGETTVGEAGRPEVSLSDKYFNLFRDLAKSHAGIVLSENKHDMVNRRLSKRLRTLGLEDFKSYCDLLSGPRAADEMGYFINALTTNQTNFFREGHHFEHLASVAVPERIEANRAVGNRHLRFWSAGCSSGEEPYSIAMTLHDCIRDLPSWNMRILATDIDTNMVDHAKAGIYQARDLDSIPAKFRGRFLEKLDGERERHRMAPSLLSLIAFKQLNLLTPWPMKGPFDAIFCRNVVIYFDKPTQRQLFDRYADILRDGCFLYIGHSESLYNVCDRFKLVGKSIYRKVA